MLLPVDHLEVGLEMRPLLRELLLGDLHAAERESRSRTERRCGDVKRPVVTPCAQEMSAAARAIVVFPFVPVTWIVGYVSCGSSSSPETARILSRLGSGMCSG